MKKLLFLAVIAMGCAVLLTAGGASAQPNRITRVSMEAPGIQLTKRCDTPAISAEGRFVAFKCDDLLLIHDRHTGKTEQISDGAGQFAMSADGRYVAYKETHDLVIYDRETRQKGFHPELGYGAYELSLNSNGRFVAFSKTDFSETEDVFVYDVNSAQTKMASIALDGSKGNGRSRSPVISADGRYVFFASDASNLVADDKNNGEDIFVHDLQSGSTALFSVEGYPFSISADGLYVAFSSSASDLVSTDANDTADVFVRDLRTGHTELVSIGASGWGANDSSWQPSISADGRYVAFTSGASNLVANDMDCVIWDEQGDDYWTQLHGRLRSRPSDWGDSAC